MRSNGAWALIGSREQLPTRARRAYPAVPWQPRSLEIQTPVRASYVLRQSIDQILRLESNDHSDQERAAQVSAALSRKRINMAAQKDFLSMPAPENYVAGLGRGATGFTTRSDLGPAREGPNDEQIREALAKRAAQLGAAPPTAYGVTDKKYEEEDEERFQDPDNEAGLFSSGLFDREDDEADRIYQDVDERMEKRRKLRRLVLPFSHGSASLRL